jgi:antitoxin (DNA-binding transcriptional repressor) of toxin-antitoxin stability system
MVSTAAASARCHGRGWCPGVAAGDQVTVTASHHPALRMAPSASSRRQCPLTAAPVASATAAGCRVLGGAATASHSHIVPPPLLSATPASMLIQAPRDLPVSGIETRSACRLVT